MSRACRIASLLLFLPGLAWAQDDAARGKVLAQRWCANCHIVAGSATAGSANGLPTFPALANDAKTTQTTLRAAMTAEHGKMPDFSLSRRQQDDLIAYIFSLRAK